MPPSETICATWPTRASACRGRAHLFSYTITLALLFDFGQEVDIYLMYSPLQNLLLSKRFLFQSGDMIFLENLVS